eukprot:365240-Chlamydomonas_euryale.AAC.2
MHVVVSFRITPCWPVLALHPRLWDPYLVGHPTGLSSEASEQTMPHPLYGVQGPDGVVCPRRCVSKGLVALCVQGVVCPRASWRCVSKGLVALCVQGPCGVVCPRALWRCVLSFRHAQGHDALM